VATGIYLQAAGGPVLFNEQASLDALTASNPALALAYQEHPDQYRPLSNLIRYLLLTATGSAASLRVASSLLHGLNAALVFLLAGLLLRRWGRGGEGSVLAAAGGALVFAAHPLASEAILSHGAFAVVAGCTFALGSVLLAARSAEGGESGGPLTPVALYLAALLCHGAYWPVALVAAALSLPGEGVKKGTGSWWSYGGTLSSYGLGMTLYYVSWTARSWPEFQFGPVHRTWPVVQGAASQAAAMVDALRLLLVPLGLSADQGRVAYLGGWNLQAVAGALLLVVMLVAGFLLVRRPTLAGLAVAWFAFLHLHVLLSPPEDPLRERRLYPLVVSLALLVVAGLRLLERHGGARTALAAAAIVCVPLALSSAGRARLWMDPEALWQSAARSNPASPRSHFALGGLYLQAGDTDRALEAYENALARSPRSAMIQASLAEVYFQRGDYSRSLQEANKAMELDPGYLPVYLTAGNSFMMRGQTRDAFLAFNAALRVNPDDPSALYNMGVLHYQQKRYVKAVRLLERALELRPEDSESLFRLGMSRFYSGNLQGAAEALRFCLEVDPERVDAQVNLATVLTKLEEHETAGVLLRGVLENEPGNAEALNGMAILASARNDTVGARDYFRQAVQADPNNLQFLHNLASSYEGLGEYEQAVDAYSEFLDRWTGSLELGESARSRLLALEARLASAQ
jgi:tetratricopeptide (TPR) repeat protein